MSKEQKEKKGVDGGEQQAKRYPVLVVADDYGDQLASFEPSTPICLQEIAGACILDYILRTANCSKVSEVYIMTSRFKAEIETHIAKYQNTYPKKIILVFNHECQSLGDWLRHVHTERLIEDNFVIIKGSCVAQLNLTAMLSRYEELQKLDKNMLLMKVFTKNSSLSDHRSLEANKYLILDHSDRVLFFEDIQGLQFRIKESDRVKFSGIKDFNLRYDLFDTTIEVCQQKVLNYYQNEFDYKSETQFLHQILHSEIEYETIHAYKIKYNEYAFDIQNPSQLHKANLDGIQGYILDMINFDPSTPGKYRERFIKTNAIHSLYCKESSLDYESTIGMNCIILENVEVGPETCLMSSVIGRGAKIGQNCQIQGSLLAKLSQVLNCCSIKDSYIGEGCEVGESAKLSCVYLEAGAKVLSGQKLENLRIAADGSRKPYQGKLQSSKQLLEDDSDFRFEEEESVGKEPDFDEEVDLALRHGAENSYLMKDIVFEVNNLKLTMHKSLLQTLVASAQSIYTSLAEALAEVPAAEKLKLIQDRHDYWKPLLDKFMDGDENKLAFLKTLLGLCEQLPQLKFSVLVQVLYKKDIVDDEAILAWFEGLPQESPSPFEKAVQEQCRAFADWLRKNNEEESESGSAEDEDEEEEEASGEEEGGDASATSQ